MRSKRSNLHEVCGQRLYRSTGISQTKENIHPTMKSIILTVICALLLSGTMVVAQSKAKSENKTTSTSRSVKRTDSLYYTCAMHPTVMRNHPGKCPKCGMVLDKKTVKTTVTKNEKHEAMKNYTCPLHTKVYSDKPGQCPKCGRELTREE